MLKDATTLPDEVQCEIGTVVAELRAAGWSVTDARYEEQHFGNWYVKLVHQRTRICLSKDRSQYMIDGPVEQLKAADLWKAFNNLDEFSRAVVAWAARPSPPPIPTPSPRPSNVTTLAYCIVAFIVLFLAFYGCLQLMRFSIVPSETTRLSDYPAKLKQWSPTGLVNHFPPTLPPNASIIRFSEYPGFLQGGGHIQLRMPLPAGELTHLETAFAQKALHIYQGGAIYDHYNEDQKNNVPTANFHTSDNPATQYAFPTHYKLYVLQATSSSKSWNHGQTAGAAISSETGEIVYWAESW